VTLAYEHIHAERATLSVAQACRILEVSRSGYYNWAARGSSQRIKADRRLQAEIVDIHSEHHGRYGSPRIHQELSARGERVGKKRVARLMKLAGISGYTPRRFRKTTDSRHANPIAPNLLNRDFSASAPNEAWVGDITYLPTTEGWLFLAVLIDLYSRRVVGWSISSVIDTQLALGALRMALSLRKPAPGLIHHTDRDCRYASADYQAALADAEVVPSMSRKADCWDNSVAESFFATVEKELMARQPLLPRKQTIERVESYIESYYNTKRQHSYLDYSTPLRYELTN
jgi:putative transposase